MRATMTLLLIILAVLLLSADAASAQSHLWSKGIGGIYTDAGYGVAVDGSDNIFVTGLFADTTDFGGTPLVAAGATDAFLAKFDPDGNHIWSMGFGDAGHEYGGKVGCDGAGNVYIAGRYGLGLDFGGGVIGDGDVFLVKFDGAGNHIWSRGFYSTLDATCYDMDVDDAGNVYITGDFDGTLDLGGGPLVAVGTTDVFLARYDNNGNHVWSQRFGDETATPGLANHTGYGVSVDDLGNLFLAGSYREQISFGGPDLTSAGEDDIFLAAFDTSGTWAWDHSFGSAGNDFAFAACADGSGGVYITGHHESQTDFGGGGLYAGMFLAKYNSAGTHLWSQKFGDTGDESGDALWVDGSGSVYLVSTLYWTVDFGGGEIGFRSIGLAKFDGNGTHQWSTAVGGGVTTDDSRGYGIVTDSSQDIIVTGYYWQSADFGGGYLPQAGMFDIFLARYGETASDVAGDTPTATALLPNSPNPFNPGTTIRFTLETAGPVRLAIFDVKGRRVATLLDEVRDAGLHALRWNGTNGRGQPLASGVYFCRLDAGSTTHSRRMVLLK